MAEASGETGNTAAGTTQQTQSGEVTAVFILSHCNPFCRVI